MLAAAVVCAGAVACGTAPTGFGSDGSGSGGSGPNGVDPGSGGGSGGDGGSSSPGSDGGSGKDGSTSKPPPGLDAAALPDAEIYDTPTTCTSGTTWTLGDQKSSDMEPGLECQTCHDLGGEASGKQFDIAGTVYPTAHEPDNCYGVSGATIVITDKNGGVTNLSVSSSGNFEHDDAIGFFKIATPYTAVVKVGSKTRPMLTAQTDGNCNNCHTTDGANDAPGRIMMP